MASGQDKSPNRSVGTAILLATFNGERYLGEQLDSLFAQTEQEWTLYVHDDGSTDGTRQLLAAYASRHANMQVLDYPPQHGACRNFISLLQRVDADRYFFCDQDDVWYADKVRLSLAALRRQEEEHPGRPIVIHSDLTVVDAHLDMVAPSFLRYTGLRPEHLSTFDTAVLPFATGCTMLLNRAARDAALRHPGTPTMHDTWAVLCTLSEGGHVELLPQSLVGYRQHGHNTLGARDILKVGLGYRLHHLGTIMSDNARHYAMLRSLGYGSALKFLVERIRYKRKTLR